MENITLEKINFVNGSAGKTPLNSNNINAIQQNTENAINEVVPIITGIEENTENNNSDIAEAKINIANNTNNILEINKFIENSMKTLSASGTSIHVNDSADYGCSLRIEGKSEQVQTENSPSPEYPSEIENVSGDLEVKVVGKNLFNYNSEVTNFGSTYATKEQISNGYKMTATITSGAQRCQLIIPMEILTVGKKYTLSYKSDFNPTKIRVGDASGIGDTTGYDKYGSFNNVTTGKITFTLTEKSKKYLIFALYNANAQTGDTYSIWNIQVEYSETATELEEYKEQAVTFPLGEQKLMKDGYLGDDGIHNKRIQIVLTGNENWTLSGRQFEKCACFHVGIDNNTKINMICNAFKYNQMAYNNRIDEECITNNVRTGSQNLIIVQIDKTRLTTQDVNGFKTWLVEQYSAGTPVIVEYELEEEETTVYTSEQQTAYNNLQKLKTYRTVTNISNSQDTNMQLTYKMDLQTQIAGGGSSA